MIGAILLLLVAGWSGWTLAVPFAALAVALPLLRCEVKQRYWAELEIAGNLAFIVIASAIIGRLHLTHHGWINVPAPEIAISGLIMTAAVLGFIVRGGNYIVRGILEKVSALPKLRDETTDVQEVRRGRLIGAVERIVLALAVAAGSYEALGFLVAAKGLIRSKEFDDRAWAEYFIIGSLLSVLIAMLGGLAIRYFLSLVRF